MASKNAPVREAKKPSKATKAKAATKGKTKKTKAK
jgi:hypothetical protein